MVKADGTLSVNYPTINQSGSGYWWVVNEQVQYSFREPFAPGSGADVQVVHLITEQSDDSFTSHGRGLIYQNNKGTLQGTETPES